MPHQNNRGCTARGTPLLISFAYMYRRHADITAMMARNSVTGITRLHLCCTRRALIAVIFCALCVAQMASSARLCMALPLPAPRLRTIVKSSFHRRLRARRSLAHNVSKWQHQNEKWPKEKKKKKKKKTKKKMASCITHQIVAGMKAQIKSSSRGCIIASRAQLENILAEMTLSLASIRASAQ